MAYKQKSGGLPFKQLGSSPARHGTTDDFLSGENGHNPDVMEGKHEDWHTDKIEAEKEKPSPNKQNIEGTLIGGTKYTVIEKPMTKQEAHAKKTKELQNKLDVKNHHDSQKKHMKKKLKEIVDKDPVTKKKMKMLEKLMKIN